MKDRASPLFILVAVITTITTLYVAKSILLPIALAILLSFLLTPLADRLERWRVPRIASVLSVVFLTFVLLGVLGGVVTNQVMQLSLDLPQHETMLVDKFDKIRFAESVKWKKVLETLKNVHNALMNGKVAAIEDKSDATSKQNASKNPAQPTLTPEKSLVMAPDVKDDAAVAKTGTASVPEPTEDETVAVKVVEQSPSPLSYLQDWLGPFLAPLATGGMVVVLVLFLLMDRENQRSRLIQLFGRTHMHATTEAVHEASARVGRYLRSLFLLNAGYGVAVAVGLAIIGVPGAVMWGVLGFSLRFLPYIGPWIAATLPLIVSIATSEGWMQPIFVLALYLTIELISNNIIEPLVYGSTTGVSTIGVIIAAIFWTWLWGPIGLILSMPMTVCLLVAARYVPQLKFINTLLADCPPASPGERIYQRLLAFDYREPAKLAHKSLKESSLTSFYDDIMLPSLVMAEQDRHGELLNDDQAEFVLESTKDLIDEVSDADRRRRQLEQVQDFQSDAAAGKEAIAGPSLSSSRILCIPLRDDADELSAHMLANLLDAQGFQAEVGAAEALTGELVDRVAESDSDIVVISVLPPIAPRDSRLLWKRLRSRYPTLPIVVGFWTAVADKEALAEPVEDSASKVVTSLAEAVTVVRGMAAHVQLAAKTA